MDVWRDGPPGNFTPASQRGLLLVGYQLFKNEEPKEDKM
jgi:hypothetical protein